MSYDIEKDWITKSGLRAVVLYVKGMHRCGYVGIESNNPAFGKGYGEQIDCISQDTIDNVKVDKQSPLLVLTAGVNSDGEGKVRRSLDLLINVHGGLTYSDGSDDNKYPVESSNIWWFGFDCGHYGDDRGNGGQSLPYCIDECESLANQLKSLEQK